MRERVTELGTVSTVSWSSGPDPGRLDRADNPAPGISPPGQPAIFPFAMKTGALDGDEKTRMLFQRTETMHAYNCPENKIEFIFEAT